MLLVFVALAALTVLALGSLVLPVYLWLLARDAVEAPQREAVTFQRSADAITGSSTLLSSSLANALWAVETGDADAFNAGQMPAVSSGWVAGAYEEFA